jgi:DNA-binding PadR family transcriptional regulator
MDVRTLCLGILTLEDATGYEIKKTFEDRLSHFFHASFGSIYPALTKLTQEGLVSCTAMSQEKRPDKKVYSITSEGRFAFMGELAKPATDDRYRSDFLATLMFSHLLPAGAVANMLDDRITKYQTQLADMAGECLEKQTDSEKFLCGYGMAVYQAAIDYINENRYLLEAEALRAQLAAAE